MELVGPDKGVRGASLSDYIVVVFIADLRNFKLIFLGLPSQKILEW